MVNVAIQALTLLSGMLVNFLVPALYGLESYGTFVQANILVFVFQKLTDIINEPLISHIEGKYVFATSLLTASFVLLFFLLINRLDPIGDPFLLGVMLLSSCCLLSMYALRQQTRLLVYLVIFLGVFGIALLLNTLANWQLSIVDILIWTNLLPGVLATLALLLSGSRLPPRSQLFSTFGNTIRMLPRMISVTLVFNLLTNILPYVLSKTLPVRDLGLFRVITSIIQSATSLFPLNTKAIFVAFVEGGRREMLFMTVMSSSLLYFSLLGLFAHLLIWLLPKFNQYFVMVSSLPVLYWAVVTERYLLASGLRRQVMMANWVVAFCALIMIFLVHDLQQAQLFYALGFSAYALALYAYCKPRVHPVAMYWVAIFSPCIIWLQEKSMAFSVIYMVSLAFIAIVVIRFRPADLRNLKF